MTPFITRHHELVILSIILAPFIAAPITPVIHVVGYRAGRGGLHRPDQQQSDHDSHHDRGQGSAHDHAHHGQLGWQRTEMSQSLYHLHQAVFGAELSKEVIKSNPKGCLNTVNKSIVSFIKTIKNIANKLIIINNFSSCCKLRNIAFERIGTGD
jgi:hypothetical protein